MPRRISSGRRRHIGASADPRASKGGRTTHEKTNHPALRRRSLDGHGPRGSGLGPGQIHHRRLDDRSEEHTSELQSLMRISYAVFCLKKKKHKNKKSTKPTCTNWKQTQAIVREY